MRWIAIWVFFVCVACKGDSASGTGTPAGGAKSDPGAGNKGDDKGGGSCKPMTGLCKRLPADELGKVFEVPAIVGTEEDHDDGPMGPMDDCIYKQRDDKFNFEIRLRYQCFDRSAGAAADYKGIHETMTKMGQHIEDVTGLGDEAYWTYSGSDKAIIQGHVKARKGNVNVQLNYASYSLGDLKDGRQVGPTIAKARAIEAIKLMFARLP